jgi:hypothetical protein
VKPTNHQKTNQTQNKQHNKHKTTNKHTNNQHKTTKTTKQINSGRWSGQANHIPECCVLGVFEFYRGFWCMSCNKQ